MRQIGRRTTNIHTNCRTKIFKNEHVWICKLNQSFLYFLLTDARNMAGGPILAYPMSLARQIVPNPSTFLKHRFPAELVAQIEAFKQCDFDMTFAANATWHFGNTTCPAQSPDFKLKAAQMMTEGLGFATNLIRFNKLVVFPKIIPAEKQGYSRYARMTPMDSFMLGWEDDASYWARNGSRIPIIPIVKEWEDMGLYDVFWPSNHLPVSIMSLARQAGMRMSQLLKHFLCPYFQLDEGDTIKFTDEGRYYIRNPIHRSTTLLSHTDIFRLGHGIPEFLRSQAAPVLYDPIMLEILQEIGYATLKNPRFVQLGPLENLNSVEVVSERPKKKFRWT